MKPIHISSSSHKRDKQALEQRRIQAVKMYKKGLSQYKIAKDLKVSFEAVSNWVEMYETSGLKGLRSLGQTGPKSKLTEADKRQIKAAIIKGPEAYGYATGIWTLERIAKLMRRLTRKSFKTTHTWRIMISLGFSCQKPQTKAKERNETAIKEWKLNAFPDFKKMGA